ncbi:MAG TPA: alpha/beta fold hydrolase [Luteibaculaceae bacterium]|nr:alpha/beta fold hydrolase [Luteibaculaceae bacterium]
MKLHVRTLGEGKPLIILHGLFGSSDNWQTLGKRYAEQRKVFLVDQRNHGHSPWSDAFSYPLLVADLLELMDDEQLPQADILGHSMGGKTAMAFAQAHPDRLEKLIVADIAPKAYPPHHQTILAALHAVDLNIHNTRKAVEEIIQAHIDDAGTRQFLLKNLYWNDQQVLAWRINIPVLSREMPAIIGDVGSHRVDVPALFIRGSESGYVRDSDIPAIQTQFPQAEFHTIEGAGHWLHAERPKEFFDITQDFLIR